MNFLGLSTWCLHCSREAKSYCHSGQSWKCVNLYSESDVWTDRRNECLNPQCWGFRARDAGTPVQGDGRNKAAQQWHGSRDRNTILTPYIFNLPRELQMRSRAEKDVLLRWDVHGMTMGFTCEGDEAGVKMSSVGDLQLSFWPRAGREGPARRHPRKTPSSWEDKTGRKIESN